MSCACFVAYGVYDEKLADIVSDLLATHEAYPKSKLGTTMLGWICVCNNVVTVTRDLMDIDSCGYNVFEKLEDDCDTRTASQIKSDEKMALNAKNVIKSFDGFFGDSFVNDDVTSLITKALVEGGVKCCIYVDQSNGYDTRDFGCDSNDLKTNREEWARKQSEKKDKATVAKKTSSKTSGKTPTANYDTKIYEITKQGNLKKYKGSKKADVVIPGVVKKINHAVFEHFGLVKNISIPNSVLEIGDEAFGFCKGITELVIPDSVITIGAKAFFGCDSLSKISIGSSVRCIGDSAFGSCKSLDKITIPASVVDLSNTAFSKCEKLSCIDVADDNPNYKSIDGNLYSQDGKVLIKYAEGKSNDTFEIPCGVVVIGDFAFSGCKSLKSIIIPDSVEKIGENAFTGCQKLKEITIPNSVKMVGSNAFKFCSSIKTIQLPNSLIEIGSYAFEECKGITSIVIPKSVTIMANNVFYMCPSITVYCEVDAHPEEWSKEWNEINWNKGRCAVIWGYHIL